MTQKTIWHFLQKIGRKNFLFSHFQKIFSFCFQWFLILSSRDNNVRHFNPKSENIILCFCYANI
nr:MAG TPA: hypothetical protein [Caudoviricetes sp.]